MLWYDKRIRQELSRNICAAMLLLQMVILNVLQWRRCVDNGIYKKYYIPLSLCLVLLI